jgi:hypothetical protein
MQEEKAVETGEQALTTGDASPMLARAEAPFSVTSVCHVARLGLLPLEVVDRAEYNTRYANRSVGERR